MDKHMPINAINIRKISRGESYFDGEHFEGHGDKWVALFGNTEKFAVKNMKKCVTSGDIIFKQEKILNKKFAGIVYPKNELLSVLSLIELKETCNEYTSAYPLLIGINNEVKLKEDYCWQNGGEGEFAVEAGDDRVINFFDPFYAIDKANFKTDKTQTISLAGLAYSLDKLKEQEFVIDKGEFYNVSRDEFLKENPDKTEQDFEPPVVKLEADHFRMLIPKQYACEYEIATQIENIKYFKILGEEIAQLKVNLEHSDNEKSLYCYIYASKHVLGKYKPQVGDGINAIVWLSGFFN